MYVTHTTVHIIMTVSAAPAQVVGAQWEERIFQNGGGKYTCWADLSTLSPQSSINVCSASDMNLLSQFKLWKSSTYNKLAA
jgi:hypothetical protein